MTADVKTSSTDGARTIDDGLSFAERAYLHIRDRLVMLDISPAPRSTTTSSPRPWAWAVPLSARP